MLASLDRCIALIKIDTFFVCSLICPFYVQTGENTQKVSVLMTLPCMVGLFWECAAKTETSFCYVRKLGLGCTLCICHQAGMHQPTSC